MNFKHILALPLLVYSMNLKSQTFRVDTSYQQTEIINDYFIDKNHNGIRIKNIQYSGTRNALGVFSYKSYIQNSIPPKGIILSTGNAIDAMALYTESTIASTDNHYTGDKDLSKIVNNKTFDSSILEFDFFSLTDSVSFIYQFASEEYPEYVDRGVSDIFGFFVTDLSTNIKENIATLPNSNIPISIDLINSSVNSHYYIPNNVLEFNYNKSKKSKEKFQENRYLFNFDGYTTPIVSGIKIKPYTWYHFKIAIADVGDKKFDSWIFLKANSFISNGEIKLPEVDQLKVFLQNFNTDSTKIKVIDDKISIEAPIYFDLNSAELNDSCSNLLNNILSILQFSRYDLHIYGFTDQIGSTEYNLILSSNRANKVKEYLIHKGIHESRISSFGKGEIETHNFEEKSRKVEFILYEKTARN